MQKVFLNKKLLKLFLFVALITACQSKGEKQLPTPAEYDLNNPEVIRLSDQLNEISGIVYYPKDSSIFAIIDESGNLFKILLKEKPEYQHWKFGKSSDYEDLVLKDSIFYVMKSKGDIIAFKFAAPDSLLSEEFDHPAQGSNEFESLYYDSAINKLVLMCKDCEEDNKDKITVWRFDIEKKAFEKDSSVIDASSIVRAINKDDPKKLKVSAAALHPLTGELYIVSSISKALVITDRTGKTKSIYKLNPKTFKQPEGITFTPWGDMIISNEAAGEGLPNLLVFKYKKAGK
jgi:uncharacterized protein YjiK